METSNPNWLTNRDGKECVLQIKDKLMEFWRFHLSDSYKSTVSNNITSILKQRREKESNKNYENSLSPCHRQ